MLKSLLITVCLLTLVNATGAAELLFSSASASIGTTPLRCTEGSIRVSELDGQTLVAISAGGNLSRNMIVSVSYNATGAVSVSQGAQPYQLRLELDPERRLRMTLTSQQPLADTSLHVLTISRDLDIRVEESTAFPIIRTTP